MGVKDLWNIVSPSCERKPLFELQGKTVAIDLSCWVVDSQMVVDNATQPKMYLRNLFFRTVYLLMQETFPVFVLEGKAPNLKHKEMDRRNKIRNGDGEKKKAQKGGRGRLNNILKECEQMLMLMGLKCVRGHGEAEAMCAYLNEDGLVDGCISQDSDCFLYGAKTVYRNFCTSVQGNRGGTSGSVDEYTIEKIERLFKLDRKKMIALALLCGCDYDDGVNGIGKEAVMKLFKIVEGEDILQRLKSWATHSKFKRMEAKLNDPNVCTSCGHPGKLRTHTKSGCDDCGTVTRCNDSYKDQKSLIKHELNLREKALAVEGFPNQELIDEFLVRKGPMPSSVDIQWRQPKIVEFVNFMYQHVCWEPEYAFAKIFSLATRWQLRHFADIPPENRIHMHGVMIPSRIKKIRRLKCVESYEIVWHDKDGVLDGLMLGKLSDDDDDDDNDDDDEKPPDELVSVEPQNAVRRCYPELAEQFESARLAKRKKPAKPRERKKKVAKAVIEEKENECPEAASGVTKKPAAKRSRRKAVVPKDNRKIDEFLEVRATVPSLEDSFEALSLASKKIKTTLSNDLADYGKPKASGTPKRGPQFDRVLATAGITSVLDGTLGRMFDELTPDDFPSDVEDDSSIMCDVIERMCNKRSTRIDSATNVSSAIRIDDNSKSKILGNSDGNNVFENYREPKKCPVDENSDEVDEFDASYVPIFERLKLANKPKFDREKFKDLDRLSLGVDDLMSDSE